MTSRPGLTLGDIMAQAHAKQAAAPAKAFAAERHQKQYSAFTPGDSRGMREYLKVCCPSACLPCSYALLLCQVSGLRCAAKTESTVVEHGLEFSDKSQNRVTLKTRSVIRHEIGAMLLCVCMSLAQDDIHESADTLSSTGSVTWTW